MDTRIATQKITHLRTPYQRERYIAALEAGQEFDPNLLLSVKDFTYWRIVANDFPYDLAFCTHHLLVPSRKVTQRQQLTVAEIAERDRIIEDYIEQNYDCMLENMVSRRSVLSYYHLHLLSYHKDISQP